MHWHRCTEQNLRWTLKPPAARGLAGTMDHGRTSFQADHRSAGFSLPWWWFFQRCWPAPVSASLAIYTNLSHLFSKGVHTAGEESGLSGELLSCKWQLGGLQKEGSKMSLVKINTKLLPLGLFQGIVMFLFNFFHAKKCRILRVSMLKGLGVFCIWDSCSCQRLGFSPCEGHNLISTLGTFGKLRCTNLLGRIATYPNDSKS